MTGLAGRGSHGPAARRAAPWAAWLAVVGAGLVVFGTAMALLAGTALFEPVHRLIDPAFWTAGPSDAGSREFRAWVYGAWGAALAGWGVVVAFVAWHALRRGERWAWPALAVGTALWFMLDTAVSLAHGVAANVVINAVVLAAVAVPLAASWPRRDA